jgi:hypothetical protein
MVPKIDKFLIFVCTLVISFTGCIKYYQLSESEFSQGKKYSDTSVVRHYFVKSITVYDQFATKAHFDVLYLSDYVRKEYTRIYSSRRGKDEEADAVFSRLLEDNRHWVSFYVLADIRERVNSVLSDPSSLWTFYLDIKGYKLAPTLIKEVELEPEYKGFFGNLFEAFKTAYLFKFPAQKLYLPNGQIDLSAKVRLVASSVTHKCEFIWDNKEIMSKIDNIIKKNFVKGPQKEVRSHEDFYWG